MGVDPEHAATFTRARLGKGRQRHPCRVLTRAEMGPMLGVQRSDINTIRRNMPPTQTTGKSSWGHERKRFWP